MKFDAATWSSALETSALGRSYLILDQTGSTNDDAREAARAGAPHGHLILAESQSAGRGRRGNAWAAPAESCLLCSLVLRPSGPVETWPRAAHALAVALARALERLGLEPALKWPNDIYLSGRKAAGILLESEMRGASGFVIAGFGVNALGAAQDFPPELRPTLTTLQAEGARCSREQVLAATLNALEPCLVLAAQDFPRLLDEAWERSWLRQKQVSLIADGVERQGRAVALSPQGGLLLKSSDGCLHEFLAADFTRVLPSGQTSLCWASPASSPRSG